MGFESHKTEPEQVPKGSSKEKKKEAPLVVPEVPKSGETRDQLNSLKTELGDEISKQILGALESAGVDANEDGKLPEGVAPDKSFLSSLGKGIVSVVNTVLEGLGLKAVAEEATDSTNDSEEARQAVESKDFGELLDPKAKVFSFPKRVAGVEVHSEVTSRKGHRERPTAGASTNHMGDDIGVPEGTPIVLTALEGATVNYVGTQTKGGKISGGGHYASITLKDGSLVYFMHLKEVPDLEKGQKLKAGDLIGYTGNSGTSTGPHLHFEVRQEQVAVNPEPWLADRYQA